MPLKVHPKRSELFVAAMTALGAAVAAGMFPFECANPYRLALFLAIALVAATLKIRLPRVRGTISAGFLFTLLNIVELSTSETVFIAASAALMQCLWKPRMRPRATEVAFNVANMALAARLACLAYGSFHWRVAEDDLFLRLALAATVLFCSNVFPVAAIIALTERKPLRNIWDECYFWSFAYYLAGALIAALLSLTDRRFGWYAAAMAMPGIYLLYRSLRQRFDRLESQKWHAEEMSALHLRTIETLTRAIDAQGDAAQDRPRRVGIYAVELGRKLGLDGQDLEALRAAALLHDIGTLAVPEHIVSKPGRLSPEEFEKMKIHPIVGAGILERVRFPYPVAPIVRAHHEKWDGSGYPDGLAREQIPLGARILAAVDGLNALASDRQYRKALPLDEALAAVVAESGKSYDPRVVQALERSYRELEALVADDEPNWPGDALAHAKSAVHSVRRPVEYLHSIAAARQEAQALFELSQDLGKSLGLHETLSVLAERLRRTIPYDAIAIYILRDGKLVPEFVCGDDFRLFSSLEIPLGEGLSGWVAANRLPILNGNPSVECGYRNDPASFSVLQSALAAPLEGVTSVVGVLTLYQTRKQAFTLDHLRVLLTLLSKISFSVENALKFRQAESCATTDYLTGLPNARSLFLHLDSEISRCRRNNSELTVMVCDLDGFKQMNDRFGHLQGNRVLQLVAARMRECCREYDCVARMGGDEFVVVMTGMPRALAEQRALEIDRITRSVGLAVCGEGILSLSVGAASFPADGATAEGLLTQADQRMYANKQARKLENPFAGTPFAPIDARSGITDQA